MVGHPVVQPESAAKPRHQQSSVFYRPDATVSSQPWGGSPARKVSTRTRDAHQGNHPLRPLHFSRRAYAVIKPARSGAISCVRSEDRRKGLGRESRHISAVGLFPQRLTEAVVITNDSDLATPIEVVCAQLKIPVGVINPQHQKFHSTLLRKVASWTYQSINQRHFRDNQLPPTITDAAGTFSKPPA